MVRKLRAQVIADLEAMHQTRWPDVPEAIFQPSIRAIGEVSMTRVMTCLDQIQRALARMNKYAGK